MKNNTDFPDPDPAIADVNTALKAFAKIELEARTTPAKETTKQKKVMRKTLIDLMKKLGKYVEMNCGDDSGKVLMAGYKVRKKAVRRKKLLDKILKINLKSKPDVSGTMLAKVVKKIARAKGYLFMYTQYDGDGYWTYLPSSTME